MAGSPRSPLFFSLASSRISYNPRQVSSNSGDLIKRNARMARNIVARCVYDPENHWMGSKIQNRIRFFGTDAGEWNPDQLLH
jgi:hypothetical protein